MKLPFSVVVTLALSCVAKADPLPPNAKLQQIVVVTNDQNDESDTLDVVSNPQGTPLGLYTELRDPELSPPEDEPTYFTLAELAQPSGVVLDTEQGRNIFILQGSLNSSMTKGAMTIKYLSNGLLGTYDSCAADIVEDSNGNWQMVNAYTGQVVTEIKAVTWALGVTTLENVCPEEQVHHH